FLRPLRIFLEQRIAAIKGYRGGRGLEDDEERLHDELHELESSYGVLFTPCDAAAKGRRKETMWLIFIPRNG
ncbi:hypothetical protein Tco_0738458, partial [Tanacetum coccineum]